MYNRTITSVLKRFATLYPVVGITGPRQSGKTTIAKLLFPNLAYISLENFDIRLQAEKDPRAFLAKYTAQFLMKFSTHHNYYLIYRKW